MSGKRSVDETGLSPIENNYKRRRVSPTNVVVDLTDSPIGGGLSSKAEQVPLGNISTRSRPSHAPLCFPFPCSRLVQGAQRCQERAQCSSWSRQRSCCTRDFSIPCQGRARTPVGRGRGGGRGSPLAAALPQPRPARQATQCLPDGGAARRQRGGARCTAAAQQLQGNANHLALCRNVTPRSEGRGSRGRRGLTRTRAAAPGTSPSHIQAATPIHLHWPGTYPHPQTRTHIATLSLLAPLHPFLDHALQEEEHRRELQSSHNLMRRLDALEQEEDMFTAASTGAAAAAAAAAMPGFWPANAPFAGRGIQGGRAAAAAAAAGAAGPPFPTPFIPPHMPGQRFMQHSSERRWTEHRPSGSAAAAAAAAAADLRQQQGQVGGGGTMPLSTSEDSLPDGVLAAAAAASGADRGGAGGRTGPRSYRRSRGAPFSYTDAMAEMMVARMLAPRMGRLGAHFGSLLSDLAALQQAVVGAEAGSLPANMLFRWGGEVHVLSSTTAQ
jgi:hypothetical protein